MEKPKLQENDVESLTDEQAKLLLVLLRAKEAIQQLSAGKPAGVVGGEGKPVLH